MTTRPTATRRRILLADDHALVRAGIRALLDTLPGLNGLEAAAQIAKLGVPTRVLMLSMHASPEYAARALAAGAAGYLNKDSAFDELATALDAIFAGRRYLCRAIDPEIVEQAERRAGGANPSSSC